MVEWSLVAVLLVTLMVVFINRIHLVQKQAELAAVRSTLGNLRTAFVLQHLHQVAGQHQTGEALQHNPFELLQQHPGNYVGELKPPFVTALPPGHWGFDAACVCVGYLPADLTDFDSPSGDVMVWYRVEQPSSGLLLLTAKERYVWQGQVLE